MFDLALEIKPIGLIRTSMKAKFDAPHQPDHSNQQTSVIELLPDSRFHQALLDLDTFSHIWLIWWFDRNKTWRPKVLPPRGPSVKRGVFATRSPHRPNQIGITAVKLISIRANKIYVGSNDLLDRTPIIDIKPYLPAVDAITDATAGWTENLSDLSQNAKFTVEYSDLAKKQLEWLSNEGINFIDRAEAILRVDPSTHRTRRIKILSHETYRMGCGAWRIIFTIDQNCVQIKNIFSGYPMSSLTPDRSERILNYSQHIQFHHLWPSQ